MMQVLLTKNYGVVQFTGTLYSNGNHQLVFESDDPIVAMAELEKRCAQTPEHIGYMLMIKDAPDMPITHGITCSHHEPLSIAS